MGRQLQGAMAQGIRDLATDVRVTGQEVTEATEERPYVVNKIAYDQTIEYTKKLDDALDANQVAFLSFRDSTANRDFASRRLMTFKFQSPIHNWLDRLIRRPTAVFRRVPLLELLLELRWRSDSL